MASVREIKLQIVEEVRLRIREKLSTLDAEKLRRGFNKAKTKYITSDAKPQALNYTMRGSGDASQLFKTVKSFIRVDEDKLTHLNFLSELDSFLSDESYGSDRKSLKYKLFQVLIGIDAINDGFSSLYINIFRDEVKKFRKFAAFSGEGHVLGEPSSTPTPK